VHYQPIAGRLIVFPAWLPHAVQPNLTEEEGLAADRISISFNFYQRRKDDSEGNTARRQVVRADLTGP
jgi:hypothetical protein